VLDGRARASAYRLGASVVAPHRLATEFLRYRVAVDLAPTDRCAVVRFTYADRGARLVFEGPGATWEWDETRGELCGHTGNPGASDVSGASEGFVVVTCTQPARFGTEGGRSWLEFEGGRGLVVEARVATSRLGFGHARASRDRELGVLSLEAVAEEGALAWERLLGRLAVEGDEPRRSTFYSCLYRCLCVPRKVHEWDEAGRLVHRAPGGVGEGRLVEDSGLSSSFRTLYPLYALAYRDELPELLEGWSQVLRDRPGEHPELAAVFAEAVAKGLSADPTAWDALTRVAAPRGPSVSSALARCYLDWCLAQWGHTLGHGAAARALDDASRGWQGLFDVSMGFFRPKVDGAWTEGFSPLGWNAAFDEGSAWQGGWAVPHDTEGLIAALGGPEVAIARLDTLLALRPLYTTADAEVQGMTQMALSDFGQYVHSLPTAQGALWFYALAGRPDQADRLTRRVLDELYNSGLEGFCGPEAVALAGWYVWACLGLYPLCPGAPDYVLGSPVFDRATVDSGDGRTLVIEALGRGVVVRRRTLAHVVLHQPRVAQADLFELGLLVCERGE